LRRAAVHIGARDRCYELVFSQTNCTEVPRDHECLAFDDGADLAGAGGEVLKSEPSSGEDGEAAFAQAAQSA
jgi:hypothetical protein